jgi:hypothetical protein
VSEQDNDQQQQEQPIQQPQAPQNVAPQKPTFPTERISLEDFSPVIKLDDFDI